MNSIYLSDYSHIERHFDRVYSKPDYIMILKKSSPAKEYFQISKNMNTQKYIKHNDTILNFCITKMMSFGVDKISRGMMHTFVMAFLCTYIFLSKRNFLVCQRTRMAHFIFSVKCKVVSKNKDVSWI